MEPIKVDKKELREVIEQELNNSFRSGKNKHRIPIFVNEAGSISSGVWTEMNSWHPEALEIGSVEDWTIDNWIDSNGQTVNEENLTQDDWEKNYEEVLEQIADHKVKQIVDIIGIEKEETGRVEIVD